MCVVNGLRLAVIYNSRVTRWAFLDLHPPVIFQLQLLTTWGDPYYIGLNGLEFYDQKHEKISLSENSILEYTFVRLGQVKWRFQEGNANRRYQLNQFRLIVFVRY